MQHFIFFTSYMILHSTNVLLYSANSDDTELHYNTIDDKITAAKLKVHFDSIRRLSDSNVNKSDRNKLKQEIVLKLVNECYGLEQDILSYNQLELLLANLPDLRNFVKDLKFALGGLSNMMDDYVNAGINFETWESICQGRKRVKTYYKEKAIRIKQAAKIYKAAQAEENESEKDLHSSLGFAVKIDLFNTQDLPLDTLMTNSYIVDEEKHHEANKASLRQFKSAQLKLFQAQPADYKLPQVK